MSILTDAAPSVTFPAPDEDSVPVQFDIHPSVAWAFDAIERSDWEWSIVDRDQWSRDVQVSVGPLVVAVRQFSKRPGIVETEWPLFDTVGDYTTRDTLELLRYSDMAEACSVVMDEWNLALDKRSYAAARAVDYYRHSRGLKYQGDLAVSVDLGPDDLSRRMTGKVRFEEDVLHDIAQSLAVPWDEFEARIQDELVSVWDMETEAIPYPENGGSE